MMRLHEAGGGMYGCSCGHCETMRTIQVSPATRDHIFGVFDVDKARAEVQREKSDGVDVGALLMGWYFKPQNP